MRYTKPQIQTNLSAIVETQHTGTVDGAKAQGLYLDHAIPAISCTISAYDADE
jgi:hypothetical protein